MGYSPQKKPFDLKEFLSKTGTRRPTRFNARYAKANKDAAPEAAVVPPATEPDDSASDG